MNNKKFFSVKMFWQSFKQLKAIGILASIIVLLCGVAPTIMEVINTKMMLKRYADNPLITEGVTATVVDVINTHGYMWITFMVITPLLVLNTWKFLNKRNTSDFYHSLSYTRECLFISKSAAIVVWLMVNFVVSYVGNTLTYLIFSRYYVIDYFTMFRLYAAMFFCCLLVFGAVSMACAITGNMFNNVCVSGLILFLPRILIMMVSSSVSNMVHIVPSDKAISFINDTQNMVVSLMLALFGSNTNRQKLVLSGMANTYTLVLAVIYIGIALLFFVKRKSECAGKATYGKVSGFVIRFVIGFMVAASGTITGVVNFYTAIEPTELEEASYVYAIVSMLLVSAVAVIIYEFFASRHFFKLKRCLLPTLAAWVFAGLVALGVYVGAESVMSYKPEKGDIEYIIMTPSYSNYYYSDGGIDYFKSISERVKIDDDKILAMVSEVLKSNIDKVENNQYVVFGRHYNNSGNGAAVEKYTSYMVYIKDGLFGKYRTLYLTEEQEKVLASNIHNVEAYKNAYYALPDYEDATVNWSSDEALNKEKSKELYNIFIEELKSVKFTDYYNCINSENETRDSARLYMNFSKDGFVYNANIEVREDVFPKTMNKYYEMNNNIVRATKSALIDGAISELEDYVDYTIAESADIAKRGKFIDMSVFIPDGMSAYVLGLTAIYNDNVRTVLFSEVAKAIKANEKIDISDDSKVLIRVGYSDYTDKENNKYVSYYIQVDKDFGFDWSEIISDEEGTVYYEAVE